MKIKKIVCSFVLLCTVLSLPVFGSEKSDFNLWGSGEVFKLDPLTDGLLLGTGTAVYGTQLLLSKGLKVNQNIYQGESYNLNDVNAFDARLAHGYNKTIDKVSDVFLVSSFALPFALAGTGSSEWMTIFTMYAETMLISQGIKESIKLGVFRPRPYMYFDGAPYKDVYEDHDWANSFLSGHSTMSFAAATFTSYTFCKYFPDSPWKYVVASGSYALASSIAVMRIMGGCHFTTDVICGAVLGTTIGFLVPWLHTLNVGKDDKTQISLLTNGILITTRL